MRWPWTKPDRTVSGEVVAARERTALIVEHTEATIKYQSTTLAEQREQARLLRARADAALARNHFGETIEAAMRSKGVQ